LESKSGGATSNRKVKGTIHWVSATHAVDAEVRLYDRLFTVPEPDSASAESSGATGAGGDFKSFINPHSLEVVTAKCEPALKEARPEERYQFERLGYFTLDPDSTPNKQVWRSEEHTSELQSLRHLVCRLLLEKKKIHKIVHRLQRFTRLQRLAALGKAGSSNPPRQLRNVCLPLRA